MAVRDFRKAAGLKAGGYTSENGGIKTPLYLRANRENQDLPQAAAGRPTQGHNPGRNCLPWLNLVRAK